MLLCFAFSGLTTSVFFPSRDVLYSGKVGGSYKKRIFVFKFVLLCAKGFVRWVVLFACLFSCITVVWLRLGLNADTAVGGVETKCSEKGRDGNKSILSGSPL